MSIRITAIYFLLILLLAGCASADTGEIAELEDQFMEALVEKDTATLSKFLDEDFILNGSSSVNETRAQYLETSAMPERDLEPIVLENREYAIHGKTVISTGSTTYTGTWKENKFTLPVRYSYVWMKKNGAWKVISAHLSAEN